MVCIVLLGEIALFGAALVLFEGTDVFSSYNSDDPQPNNEISQEFTLAGISVIIQLFVSIVMIFLYSRQPKAATITNTLLIFTDLGGVVGLSVFYTKYWNMIWLVGFGVAVLIEIMIVQMVFMVVIYGIYK